MILVGQRCAEQRHDPVAHDLVDGPLVAVDRFHHAFEDGIQELARLLGVPIGEELHRALQVREEDRDLLALALEGTPDRLGYEDWDFWLQAAKRGWGFVRIPEIMLAYRVRSDSMVRACRIPENHRRLVGYLAMKHRDFYAAHLPEILALARRSEHLEATFQRMKASAFWRARGVYVRLRRLFDRSWS